MINLKISAAVFAVLFVLNGFFIFFRNTAALGIEKSADLEVVYASSNIKNWVKSYEVNRSEDLLLSFLLKGITRDTADMVNAVHLNKVFWSGFQNRYGPPSVPEKSSILERFYLMKQNETTLYCDDLSNIYGLFAQHLKLKCRQIDLVKRENKKMVSQHVLSELWLPSINQWIAVDASIGAGAFINDKGHLLTAVELYYTVINKELNKLQVLKKGSFNPLNTADVQFLNHYYTHTSSLAFVDPSWFNPRGIQSDIVNYFTSKTYFSYFGQNFKPQTFIMHIKNTVFAIMGCSFFLFFIYFFKNSSKI